MADGIILKVYNKEDKLNLLIRDSKFIKIVSIYKYNGENMDIHSFSAYKKEELDRYVSENKLAYKSAKIILKTPKRPYHAYYEMHREVEGVKTEYLMISDIQIEHFRLVGDMEEVKTTENLESGNLYEKRTKHIDGETYTTEFVNGILSEFKFKLRENKINEYLKKTRHGKKD